MNNTNLNGIKLITKDEYDSITPDADTKYIVKDGENVAEYLGDIKIKG